MSVNKKYTMYEIYNAFPKARNAGDFFWGRYVTRFLSYPLAWLFLRLGIGANIVSYASILVVMTGVALLCMDSSITRLCGVILIEFWMVLDCVDGNIARVTKRSSPLGSMIDAFSGYYAFAFVFLGVGTAAYMVDPAQNALWIFLGAVASISSILPRLMTQKRRNIIATYPQDGNVTGTRMKNIDVRISIVGYFMPLLILAAIFNAYSLLTIVYTFISVASLIAMTIYYIYDAEKRSSK
jgi:phosphatidylglycerophosphate synthase